MECKINNELITEFLFGSIEIQERTVVEKHLLDCRLCLKSYINLKRDVDISKAMNEDPSAVTRARIFKAARSILRAKTKFNYSPRRMMVGGFVAIAAAILIAVFVKNFPQIEKTSERPSEINSKIIEETIDSGGVNPNHLNTL